MRIDSGDIIGEIDIFVKRVCGIFTYNTNDANFYANDANFANNILVIGKSSLDIHYSKFADSYHS